MADLICPDLEPACRPDALCQGCLHRTLTTARPQARVIGQCWAERVARDPAHRGQATWPDGPKAVAIAERLVAQLATDPRLVEDLARACLSGAAAWWAGRPARYRA